MRLIGERVRARAVTSAWDKGYRTVVPRRSWRQLLFFQAPGAALFSLFVTTPFRFGRAILLLQVNPPSRLSGEWRGLPRHFSPDEHRAIPPGSAPGRLRVRETTPARRNENPLAPRQPCSEKAPLCHPQTKVGLPPRVNKQSSLSSSRPRSEQNWETPT